MTNRTRLLASGGLLSLVWALAYYRDLIGCWWASHDPKRHPMGGFVCRRCGLPGASLSDLGFDVDADHVSTVSTGAGSDRGAAYVERKER